MADLYERLHATEKAKDMQLKVDMEGNIGEEDQERAIYIHFLLL